MTHCKRSSLFFLLGALLAATAAAQSPAPLMAEEQPEAIHDASVPGLSIRIRDVGEATAADTPASTDSTVPYLAEPTAPIVSDDDTATHTKAGAALWDGVSAEHLVALLSGVSHGISSPTLRNLALRALLSDTVDSATEDLLAARSDALLRMGQTTYARRLLEQVAESDRKPHHAETLFLFRVVSSDNQKALCKHASTQLESHASPLWQRWVVLCQAMAGESDKAQLGLDLLEEQNEYSEFYHKIAQSQIDQTPLASLPEMVYLEQAAWLIFTNNRAYLEKQSAVPLALVSLTPEETMPAAWQPLFANYGLPETSIETPLAHDYAPTPLSAETAKKNPRAAFLDEGLREALGLPAAETDSAPSAAQYKAEYIIASPRWRKQLSQAAIAKKQGEVILLLATLFTESLNNYAPEDIIAAVAALKESGLSADATALAEEAMNAATAS